MSKFISQALQSPVRLDALRESKIQTARIQFCADVPDLIRDVLHVPFAMFTAIDAERQIFIHQAGFTPAMQDVGSIPAETSICAYVIAADGALAIENTRQNVLTSEIEILKAHGLAAYIGEPVRFKGQAVGSICAFDTRPRNWTRADAASLADIARFAECAIDEAGTIDFS